MKPEITAHQLNGKITVVATHLFAVFNVKKNKNKFIDYYHIKIERTIKLSLAFFKVKPIFALCTAYL